MTCYAPTPLGPEFPQGLFGIPENFPPKQSLIRCCWMRTRGGSQILWSLESTGGDDFIIFRWSRSLLYIQRWSRSLLFNDDHGASVQRRWRRWQNNVKVIREVPADRLLVWQVKEGWGQLCQVLFKDKIIAWRYILLWTNVLWQHIIMFFDNTL